MKDHQKGKEGSQAISRKDENANNAQAKKDHPEAPEPVIGMNDERGKVSRVKIRLKMLTARAERTLNSPHPDGGCETLTAA